MDLQNRGFIEVTNTATTLIIDKVHRYDAGRYTLEASNTAGKKDASFLVKIYGIFFSYNYSFNEVYNAFNDMLSSGVFTAFVCVFFVRYAWSTWSY